MYLIQWLLLDRISPSMTDCLIHKIIHPSKSSTANCPGLPPFLCLLHRHTCRPTAEQEVYLNQWNLGSWTRNLRGQGLIVHQPVDSPLTVIQSVLTSDRWVDRLVGSIFQWWTFKKMYWSTNGLCLWTTVLEGGKKYRKSVDSDLKWWLQMSVNYNNFQIMN